MQIFHELEIANVQPNTKNAILVEFAIPINLKEKFRFQPGQHVVLNFKIERNHYRRTYSLCSAPQENKLCISVKRQHKGIISNYINDSFFKGLTVKVSEPFGNFYNDEQIQQASTVILWAGGSGITPLINIAKHILHKFPNITIQFIYANTNDKTIMFETEIKKLENIFSNRFFITHILSNSDKRRSVFFRLLSFAAPTKEYKGLTGYITPELIHTIVHKDTDAQAVHYICGPEKMMELCEQTLQSKGVAAVYIERFTGTTSIKNSNKDAMLKVRLHKKVYDIKLEENSLLEAMLATKLDPPYACKMGTCGSCKATLISGEVIAARDFALNEADRVAGKILCCQTWAKSSEIEIEY